MNRQYAKHSLPFRKNYGKRWLFLLVITLEVEITEKCSCFMSGLNYSCSLSQSFHSGIIIWIFRIPDAISLFSLQNNTWTYLLFSGCLSSQIVQVNQLNLCAPKWVCYLSTEALHAQKAQRAPFIHFAQKQILPEGSSQNIAMWFRHSHVFFFTRLYIAFFSRALPLLYLWQLMKPGLHRERVFNATT